jgi:glutathione S-transferase
MKLYNAGISPNALRVRAVVFELGLDVEIIDVNLRDSDAKVATLLPFNPNTKVPTLVDGDFVLWESRAINGYLAGLKPEAGLYPSEPRRRAIIDQWSYWQAIHLGPAMQRVSFERFLKARLGAGEPDEAAIAPQVRETAQFLGVLDGNLADKTWVAGDDLSLADFAMATTFMYRDVAGIALEGLPNAAAWITRLEARPSLQHAVAPIAALIAG